MAETTPVMDQYAAIKAEHKDEVLFFRLGDFYEMFNDDAREVSKLLNLTLTRRGVCPMCGIPFHTAKNYISRLLNLGKKVAICEQFDVPSKSNQIARREVVQVITPATVVDEEFLEPGAANCLLAFYGREAACCDVSTGDIWLTSLGEGEQTAALMTLCEQTRPKEIVVCDDEYFLKPALRAAIDSLGCLVNKAPASHFSAKEGFALLCKALGTENLEAFGLRAGDPLLAPAAALLRYVGETAMPGAASYFNLSVVRTSSCLQIDEATRRNLELFENNRDRSPKGSLFETICRTRTPGGRRLLQLWLSFPLVDMGEINFRQDWTAFLIGDRDELARLKAALDRIMDLQRLANRVALNRATPRDLRGIAQTLGGFFEILEGGKERYLSLLDPRTGPEALEGLVALASRIDQAVNPACMGPFIAGQTILDGCDAELDDARSMLSKGDERFERYLEALRAETGIASLKIVRSRTSGMALEVSKAQLAKVPPSFFRRQTLVNAERYTTAELSSLEEEAQSCALRAEKREREIYDALLEETRRFTDALNDVGRLLSTLDCFQSFATQALEARWRRPVLVSDDVLNIVKGRHPVVERHLSPGSFVPNDTIMDKRLFLITGPNMAGKSTYLRQTALIVLLAHIGSFVPAESATIGLTDKIFCRVGASDNLARGESTFLVEMEEAAFILRACTRRSLVIMDEIGRGTSAREGMSIAHAIIDFLLRKGAKTLFATHFHELTLMDTTGMELLTLAVEEKVSSIKFLRKLVPGSASSSYALHAARMAGIPAEVIREASKFQRRQFADYGNERSLFSDGSATGLEDEVEELRLKADRARKLADEIAAFDIDASTPVQAMLFLQKLKEEVRCS